MATTATAVTLVAVAVVSVYFFTNRKKDAPAGYRLELPLCEHSLDTLRADLLSFVKLKGYSSEDLDHAGVYVTGPSAELPLHPKGRLPPLLPTGSATIANGSSILLDLGDSEFAEACPSLPQTCLPCLPHSPPRLSPARLCTPHHAHARFLQACLVLLGLLAVVVAVPLLLPRNLPPLRSCWF